MTPRHVSRWKALFRFSLTEALVGMLLMAGMFFINKRYEDSVENFDPRGRGDQWYWIRDEGFPYKMREMISVQVFKDIEKLDMDDIISDHTRTFGPRVRATAVSKLTPPDSFMQEELFISGIVYNVLIDLAVLLVLHAGYVLGWRERRKAKLEAAPHVA